LKLKFGGNKMADVINNAGVQQAHEEGGQFEHAGAANAWEAAEPQLAMQGQPQAADAALHFAHAQPISTFEKFKRSLKTAFIWTFPIAISNYVYGLLVDKFGITNMMVAETLVLGVIETGVDLLRMPPEMRFLFKFGMCVEKINALACMAAHAVGGTEAVMLTRSVLHATAIGLVEGVRLEADLQAEENAL
jgi:hypothetical protein